MKSKSRRTKTIALSGILLALTVIVLYVESILPVSKLSLYALSSFFVSVIIMESGVISGWIFYVASVLLALIIVPDKLALLPYILFFGLYGIIKCYIEKIRRLYFEYVLKYLFFNISLAAGVLTVKELLLQNLNLKLPWWALILGAQIVFIIYDYFFSRIIVYYNTKIKNKLPKIT